MGLDVHLDQLDLAARLLDDFFEDGSQLPALAVRRGPEIHQHRLARRFGDDILPEGGGGCVFDETSARIGADGLRLACH